MPITESTRSAIDATLASLGPAIASLQNRKDYARKDAPFDVPAAVAFFQAFQQSLQICEAKDDQGGAKALADQTQKTVLPKIEDIVSSNIGLSNMGQLNTKRTIEPETALAQNVLFDKLQKASMQFVASVHGAQEANAVVTIDIVSITFSSRHVTGGGMKLLCRDGAADYQRDDGQQVHTDLDATAGAFNAAEWAAARGVAGEPFSQTMNTPPEAIVVCRLTAQGGDVTVNGFTCRLDGVPLVDQGVALLPNHFQIDLAQAAAVPDTPLIVNNGAHVNFTVTFNGGPNCFPDAIGAATLALTATVQTDAGPATAAVNAAGTVYLTFDAPGGAVQSLAANDFSLGGPMQDVTPARLRLAMRAAYGGWNSIIAGLNRATNYVDAIFLFLKAGGIRFSLGYRWVPLVNETGFGVQPPLHTYLWMSLSPSALVAPHGLPATEAWAECHNLAVAFALMGEILGLTPFVVNFGNGDQFGYARNYPWPRRQDVPPNPPNVPQHGCLNAPYTRIVFDPNGNQGLQQLSFEDQNGGRNYFEGVTVFNNVRLYPLGECVLAEANRDTNADNYYCYYGGAPDYVDPPNNRPADFDANAGLLPIYFYGDWIAWFQFMGGIYWDWQNDGVDPDPYPGTNIPDLFMWED